MLFGGVRWKKGQGKAFSFHLSTSLLASYSSSLTGRHTFSNISAQPHAFNSVPRSRVYHTRTSDHAGRKVRANFALVRCLPVITKPLLQQHPDMKILQKPRPQHIKSILNESGISKSRYQGRAPKYRENEAVTARALWQHHCLGINA